MSLRRDLDRLTDMRDALTDIKALTADGRQAFETDRSAQQAVAYNLAVLQHTFPYLVVSVRSPATAPLE